MAPKAKKVAKISPKITTGLGEGRDGNEFSGFQKTELREKKKAAELGYLAMDITEPPKGAFWGKFNDQKVDEKWVNYLVMSFTENLDNCTDAAVIEIAVKKSWVKNMKVVLTTVDGRKLSDVLQIEFTNEGKQAITTNNLWMLGRNHQHKALIEYRKIKSEELKAVKNQIGKISGEEAEAGGDGPDLEAMKNAMKVIEEKIAASSVWVI
ncbi:hypothetical protein H4582DRAFT_2088588 [Lactarius indigo]|nr:hypothetical protein H4582DRAFT_2088588 [Lactarius indigo]